MLCAGLKPSRLSRLTALGVMAGVLLVASPAPASAQPLQRSVTNIVSTGLPGAWGIDTASGAATAGVASLASGEPTQATMKGRVGSVTKELVAAVALQLVAEGRLRLSDTVQRWLPGLLPYGNQVTIKQLMNHTSGVPEYLESGATPLLVQFINSRFPTIGGAPNPDYDPAFTYRSWTPSQLIARISGEPRHVLPPNQAEYSDSNYIVLGMALQSATGQSIQSLLQARVLTPLGLTNTSFPVNTTTLPSPRAHGYSYAIDGDGLPVVGERRDFTDYNPSFAWTTGALVSNPADLNKFQKAFIGNAIPGHHLPSWLVTEMRTTVPITLPEGLFPPGFNAGLGIWRWDLAVTLDSLGVANNCAGKQVWGHEGEMPGYDTWSFASATGTRAISVLVNQMVPEWDSQYYALNGQLPQYALAWC